MHFVNEPQILFGFLGNLCTVGAKLFVSPGEACAPCVPKSISLKSHIPFVFLGNFGPCVPNRISLKKFVGNLSTGSPNLSYRRPDA